MTSPRIRNPAVHALFILRQFLQASTSTSNFVGSLPLLLLFGVKRQVMSSDQYYQVS
jgi:hypothetical protein